MPSHPDVTEELSRQRIDQHRRDILDYAREHTKTQTGRWCKAQGFNIRREILFAWLQVQPEYQAAIPSKRAHKSTQKIPPGNWASFESKPIPRGYGFTGADLALVPTMQRQGPPWPVRRLEEFSAAELAAIQAKLARKDLND